MRITYDPEADAIYIYLQEHATADHGVVLEEGVTSADVDADGHVIGIEVLGARKRLGANPLNVVLELLSGADDEEDEATEPQAVSKAS